MSGPRSRLKSPLTLAIAALAFLAAGCNGSSSSGGGSTPTAQLRVIHASPDAPNVDVVINNTTALSNVAYKGASAFTSVPATATAVSVRPTGTSTSVIDATLNLTEKHSYTAIAIGLVAASAPADEKLQAVVVDDPGNAPASGNVKVRVLHGAPGVPAVDIYVTAPGASLPDSPTIAGLAYAAMAPASGSNALEVTGGSYEIRATVSGDASKAVVFDSGTVSLPANGDLLVTAIPASGVAPVSLLVAPSTGASFVIADGRAALRVAHLSPNAPAVDVSVLASGTTTSVLSLPHVTFPADSGYALVPAGNYDASIALSSNPSMPVLTLTGAALAGDTSTSVFAIGLAGASGAQALQLAAFVDDRVPLADKAKVRVIHIAPDAPAVDVVALDGSGAIAATLVVNLAYPNATASDLQVAPGNYTLAVVPTGATSPVLPTSSGVTVTLSAGQIVTVAAVGCLNTLTGPCAGGSPFTFKVLSDN